MGSRSVHKTWESRWRAYFRIFSTVSGKASISENAAQCSNLSTARTCAIIVRGAPELSTSFLSLAASPGSSSSQDSCSLSSLANWPALFPIDSSLPAHFTLIAFSWSRSGVDEFPSSPLSALNFLLGWMTFFTSGATVANLLRLATDPSVSSARAPSQSPNPSWKHVDWRKTFSAEIANLQKCSRAVGCEHKTRETSSSQLPAHSATSSTNSELVWTSIAWTKAKLASGDFNKASENSSEKIGRERIFTVHLSLWAMITSDTATVTAWTCMRTQTLKSTQFEKEDEKQTRIYFSSAHQSTSDTLEQANTSDSWCHLSR